MRPAALLIGVITLGAWCAQAAPVPQGAPQATITSDELELVDNGVRSVFRGNVVLTQAPYVLTADRMERTRESGVVEVYGHVKGTWMSPKGEKILATGQRGRYRPDEDTVELWDHPKLTRWETVKDTAPVTVTAGYFIAYRNDKTVWAKHDVYMEQRPRVKAESDFAKYDQNEQALHMWGKRRVIIHVEDAKGAGDFESERALIHFSPRAARLMDQVHGHVIPAKT